MSSSRVVEVVEVAVAMVIKAVNCQKRWLPNAISTQVSCTGSNSCLSSVYFIGSLLFTY